ncbi:MAG: thiolase family protein [Thermoleophilia bacterium]|nr:thiolase family protein [Thermoleophilia bacterium]
MTGDRRAARIVAAVETPYTRHPAEGTTTETLLADAFVRVLAGAGLDRADVDGLGVASFTHTPDRAIDLAWKLGVRPRWLMDDGNGGASGIQLLHHAMRAIEAGDATTVVLLSGDHFDGDSFRTLVDNYNRTTAEVLAGIPTGGPNVLFAMLTQQQMEAHGLEREDYGRLVVAQRRWAGLNPGAVYRAPLTLEEYLASPIVAEPLHRLDCVPVVSGADALVVSAAGEGVTVRALRALHNHDGQEGDGLQTGIAEFAGGLWGDADAGPEDMDVVSVYDDYPAMALAQLADLGFVPDGDLGGFLRRRFEDEPLAVNTSGGQLSAGQAGCAGGMHGLVEVVTQLLGRAGERQVESARLAVVTGYGMVLYRYGACANAVVLEAP